MEQYELLESPNVLQLYLEAFELHPTYTPTQHVQKRGSDGASTSNVHTDSVQ